MIPFLAPWQVKDIINNFRKHCHQPSQKDSKAVERTFKKGLRMG
jgi:hypothetical protein